MRLQLSLNVRDLEEAVDYYSRLFDAKPHKRRKGYANFAIDEPPLKLVLVENPGASQRFEPSGRGSIRSAEVAAAGARFEAAGIADRVSVDETCCHATQDKVWSREPQGLNWEWYRITDDNPDPRRETPGAVCCAEKQQVENRASQ